MSKTCKICGCNLTTERKYCKECKKQLRREYLKAHYKKLQEIGKYKKRYGIGICIYCGKEFIKNRPGQIAHGKCINLHKHKTVDNYNRVKRTKDGKATLGRQRLLDLNFIMNNLVVHHIDENPSNNKLSNLMVLNKSHHAKLHRILERNWSLLSKDNNSNLENCWNILRDQLTTAYLEINSANVIKITDIGRSAAEPLNSNNIYIFVEEEGSETMYQAPKSNTQGEDIVQTQTIEK